MRGTLRLGSAPNTRQLLSTFHHFVDTLRLNTKLQVEVLQQPFDIESGKALRSGDTSQDDDKPRTFSLQVIRKIGS